MYLISGISHAQINTKPMNCSPTDPSRPVFSVEFQHSYVNVWLKGNAYRLPFDYAYVDGDGDKWSVYQNNLLRVSTTLPTLNLVSVGVGSGAPPQRITGGKCF